MQRLAALLISALTVNPCLAQSAPPSDSLESLGGLLKPILLDNLPKPLYEKSTNWGHQAMTPHHVEWRGIRPKVVKKPRNDGTWRKVRINAQNPASTFDLKFTDLKGDGPDRQTFKGHVALQVEVEMEQQLWESGIRLYSGSVRARLKLKLAMDCESTLRIEKSGSFFPDTVFRLRVLKADVSYDDLVVEHLPGFGGTGAKLMGEALRNGLTQWRPSLERDLLAKANAAVVKAADTKEMRISLGKLFK